MVNTPIPTNLKSEAQKAAKILKEFSIPSASSGPDKIIPAGLIENASGLAILTVFKLGFLVTARGGSGIVIAKLPGGEWSAPSAIGIAGLGGGFEIGAEVTDFVIVLYKQSAVDAFSKGGNLTLGGNFTIAAGPLGRNLEGDIAVRSPAAMYTYSKTKGLFAGISIEGSVLIERKDANRKFYGEDIRASAILCGDVEPPAECEELYIVLHEHREMAKKAAVALAKKMARDHGKTVIKSGMAAAKERVRDRFADSDEENDYPDYCANSEEQRRRSSWAETPNHHNNSQQKPAVKPKPGKSTLTSVVRSMSMHSRSAGGGSRSSKVVRTTTTSVHQTKSVKRGSWYRTGSADKTTTESLTGLSGYTVSNSKPSCQDKPPSYTWYVKNQSHSSKPRHSSDQLHSAGGAWGGSDQSHSVVAWDDTDQSPAKSRQSNSKLTWQETSDWSSSAHPSVSDWDKAVMVRALWPFKAQMPCDLEFDEGDEIEVLTRTETSDDWWEGRIHGKTGIFPANYTQLLP